MQAPRFLTTLLLSVLMIGAFTAPAPAQTVDEEVFVVVQAGRIITVAGEEIEDGEIVIVDGEIRLVGRDLDYPPNATIIDARDQVVMPGMVHARSRYGLTGYRRSGVHSNYDVADEVNWDEIDTEDLLKNGFTAVCLIPDGDVIPGMARVYRTAGPEDQRVLAKTPYLRVSMDNPGRDKQVLRNAFKKARSEIEKVEKARKEWEEKQKKAQEAEKKKQQQEQDKKGQSAQQDEGDGKNGGDAEDDKPEEFKPPATDPAHERIIALLREEATYPLLIEVNGASELLHAWDVLENEDVPYKLFLGRGGGSDYNYVIDRLEEEKLAILTIPSMGYLPQTATRFNYPAELVLAGCEPAFVPAADFAGAFEAYREVIATAVRAGLPREDAIHAMTAAAAEFVGVGDRLGAIEKGKHADLVFLDGDPVDPLSRVRRVMVLGEIVWEAEE